MSEAVAWPAVGPAGVAGVFGIALDAASTAASARLVARVAALAATERPGALFDVEPARHARALAQEAAR